MKNKQIKQTKKGKKIHLEMENIVFEIKHEVFGLNCTMYTAKERVINWRI